MGLPISTPSTEADPVADLAFLAEHIKPKEDNVVKKLSQHIDKVWQQNQKDNKQVRLDMISLLRRIRGEYDPIKLTAIRAFRGSEAFIRSSENKARAATSWIKDIYSADGKLPFNYQPTEVPDLPDETMEQVKQQTMQQAYSIEQEIIAAGAIVDQSQVAKLMQDYYDELLDKAREDIASEAKERCKRATKLVHDQNQEGGWNNAFKDFLYYFVRLKAGIIKGPILTKKKKQQWLASEIGYTLETVDVLMNDVYCVSPFNFFPSKGMKTTDDGDIIEIHELTKQSVSDLIGVAGYSDEEIKAVLDKYGKGEIKSKWFVIDDEIAVRQVTREKNYQSNTVPSTQNSTDLASEMMYAQEFYGTVSGSMLIEWGSPEQLDPHVQYQVNCWKIGDHVIKAVISPDSLGRKPYHVSSWAKNPEWIWGEGLIEFAAPIEDAMNAVIRALINNVAISSGPMAEIDKDRVDMKQPIYPWRQIESTSMQMKNDGPAVIYYQPQMHGGELVQIWQFLSKVLDEMTVPAYAQGASQSGVTAGTATVFTQLLSAATRSVQATVENIDDDVVIPYGQMCYDYNMKFTNDDSIKGDARTNAIGVKNLKFKEQQSQRKIELLQVVANPAYMQILGSKNIGALLAQIMRGSDIMLPDLDRLDGNPTAEMQIQQMLMAQAGVQPVDPMQDNGQNANGGGGIKKAQGTRPDGEKAGVVL